VPNSQVKEILGSEVIFSARWFINNGWLNKSLFLFSTKVQRYMHRAEEIKKYMKVCCTTSFNFCY
jgi:hypothetical protein